MADSKNKIAGSLSIKDIMQNHVTAIGITH